MSTEARAAVFHEVGRPLELSSFPVPGDLPPGAAVCRVRMSTICGSDLHTVFGRRSEPTPLILGHEILGELIARGDGLEHDGRGRPLALGDRVTWTIMASCGACDYCGLGLPQKCRRLRKYGHTSIATPPELTGGYAEYVYLWPGTTLFRVPDALADEVATPANCALATVVNALTTIGSVPGEHVLIQGAGLLGLNLVALVREAGAGSIAVTDRHDRRLALARRFGADLTLNVEQSEPGEVVHQLRAMTPEGRGIDMALEVSGSRAAPGIAFEALRIGGRYLVAGLVTPGSGLGLDGNQLTRKCLTLKGIHNYRPEHLGRGVEFLECCADRYPFEDLVGARFGLDDINEAIAQAATGHHVRVAVVP